MCPDGTIVGAETFERQETTDTSVRRPRERHSTLRRVGLGLVGGLVATVAMTVFRFPISESPPPTAAFWAKFLGGGEPEDHPIAGLVLHLGYGAAGGILFGLIPTSAGSALAREQRGVLLGLGYSILLSFFGERAILARLLGMDLSPDERFVFHVGHVVYGLTLGTWVGSKLD